MLNLLHFAVRILTAYRSSLNFSTRDFALPTKLVPLTRLFSCEDKLHRVDQDITVRICVCDQDRRLACIERKCSDCPECAMRRIFALIDSNGRFALVVPHGHRYVGGAVLMRDQATRTSYRPGLGILTSKRAAWFPFAVSPSCR